MDTNDLYEHELQKILEINNQKEQAQKELNKLREQISTAKNTLRITRQTRAEIREDFRKEIYSIKREIKQLLGIKKNVDNLVQNYSPDACYQLLEEKYQEQKELLDKELQQKIKEKASIESSIQKLNDRYIHLNKTRGIAKFTPEKLDALEAKYNKLMADLEERMQQSKLLNKEKQTLQRELDKLHNQYGKDLDKLKIERDKNEERYREQQAYLSRKESRIKNLHHKLMENLAVYQGLEDRTFLNTKIRKSVEDLLFCDDNGFKVDLRLEDIKEGNNET